MLQFQNRRAIQLETEATRVTVLEEGGHVAELLHKESGVNPLWIPPWASIEPSTYNRQEHPEYGADAESKLLSGLMGHNLCLDLFGGPSPAEAAAGITVHGEASVATYDLKSSGDALTQEALLRQSQLWVRRRLSFTSPTKLRIEEEVENVGMWDRPIAWTQHVTLGPPFIEPGLTQFAANATKSKVLEKDFTGGKGYMRVGADFDWPHVPKKDGGTVDLRVYPNFKESAGYTSHLMDPGSEEAFFKAWSPKYNLLIAYRWKRADFPWLGIWEENHSRTAPPWNGRTLTRGMEFGASPVPESRREMIERGQMFGVPGYRWIAAKQRLKAVYEVEVKTARNIEG